MIPEVFRLKIDDTGRFSDSKSMIPEVFRLEIDDTAGPGIIDFGA